MAYRGRQSEIRHGRLAAQWSCGECGQVALVGISDNSRIYLCCPQETCRFFLWKDDHDRAVRYHAGQAEIVNCSEDLSRGTFFQNNRIDGNGNFLGVQVVIQNFSSPIERLVDDASKQPAGTSRNQPPPPRTQPDTDHLHDFGLIVSVKLPLESIHTGRAEVPRLGRIVLFSCTALVLSVIHAVISNQMVTKM